MLLAAGQCQWVASMAVVGVESNNNSSDGGTKNRRTWYTDMCKVHRHERVFKNKCPSPGSGCASFGPPLHSQMQRACTIRGTFSETTTRQAKSSRASFFISSDELTDCCADRCADRCGDRCTDRCADCCTDRCADCCTDRCADHCTDRCTDSMSFYLFKCR